MFPLSWTSLLSTSSASNALLSSLLECSFLATFLTSMSSKSSMCTLLDPSGFLASFFKLNSFLILIILSALPTLVRFLVELEFPSLWNVGISVQLSMFPATIMDVIRSVLSSRIVPDTSPILSITSRPSKMSSPSSTKVSRVLSIIQSTRDSFTPSGSGLSSFQLFNISIFSITISMLLPAHFILSLSIFVSILPEYSVSWSPSDFHPSGRTSSS